MKEFIINPKNYQTEYIGHLNECFNGWGGQKEYDWVFNRKIGNHSSDLMLIQNEQDGVIAGSGISYRKLCDNKTTIEIGIMTGSWTLPAARKKGCFSKIINKSKELCSEKGVPFLTAFVTSTNPSSRRLESAGSYMLPSYHLFSPEKPFQKKRIEGTAIEVIQDKRGNSHDIYDRFQKNQKHFLSFAYTPGEFFTQYINRIQETTILKVNNDFAILEDGKEEIKILLLTCGNVMDFEVNIMAVTNWCLENRSKKAFFYTTRKELADVCENLSFHNLPGYFTILSSDDKNVPTEANFNSLLIHMADKM